MAHGTVVSTCCLAPVKEVIAMDGVTRVCQQCFKECEVKVKRGSIRTEGILGSYDVPADVEYISTNVSKCCGTFAYKTGVKQWACAHCGLACKQSKRLLPIATVKLGMLEIIRLQELIRVHFGAMLPVIGDKLKVALELVTEAQSKITTVGDDS